MATETLEAPVRELTTGLTFAGRYQVIEELGHGGMGRVYTVQDSTACFSRVHNFEHIFR